MQWTEIQKDWKNVSKKFTAKWPKLVEADITASAGKRDELVKHLVKHYKTDKVKLEKEVDEFIKTLKPAKV
jgi:hypothetical protein